MIEVATSNVPAWFRDYANQLRESHSVQAAKTGRGRGGGAVWWRNVDQRVKCFILSAIVQDDWERYIDAPWDSLPDDLRSGISLQARSIERMVSCCPWR